MSKWLILSLKNQTVDFRWIEGMVALTFKIQLDDWSRLLKPSTFPQFILLIG